MNSKKKEDKVYIEDALLNALVDGKLVDICLKKGPFESSRLRGSK